MKNENVDNKVAVSPSVPLIGSTARELEEIKNALHDYHRALDNREHGGVAAGRFVKAVETVFNLHWYQGITKEK